MNEVLEWLSYMMKPQFSGNSLKTVQYTPLKLWQFLKLLSTLYPMLTTTRSQFSVTPPLPLPASKIITPPAQQSGKNITYTQIFGHFNIFGNEQIDKTAKLAHSSPDALTLHYFSSNDIKRVIEYDTLLQCQREWNKTSSKLIEIKNSIQPFLFPVNTSRKHETSINRLRIGHIHLTHSYLMKNEDPPPIFTHVVGSPSQLSIY